MNATLPPESARRRSRLLRAARWIGIFLIVFAIVGFFVAPPIIKSQAEKILSEQLGRATSVEEVKVNPFTPSVTLRGFSIREADGTQPFVTFEELYVRASYTSIFRLAPVVDQIRLTKPYARIVRLPGERFNFSDIQERFAAKPASPPSGDPPRFALFNIEVIDGRVEVDDRVVVRKHEIADIDLGLPFVSSLSSQRDVFVEPRFSAKLNGALIEAEAKSKPFTDSRESTVNLDLKDLDLTPFVVYSPAKVPVNVVAAKLDLDLDVTFAQPPGKSTSIVIAGRTNLKSVVADFPAGGPLLRVASVATELAAIEPLANRFEIAKIRVVSPEIWVRRDKGGEFVLAPLFRAPAPARAAAPGAPARPADLVYRLDELAVEGGVVHWLDERGSRPIELDLRELSAAVRGVSSTPGSKLTFQAGGVTDLKETIALDGEATLEPIEAIGKARLEKISLPRVWPLAEHFVAAELTSGRVDAATRFNYGGSATNAHLALDGIEVAATDLSMRQPRAKQPFMQLASFELRDGAFDLVQRRVALGEVASKGTALERRSRTRWQHRSREAHRARRAGRAVRGHSRRSAASRCRQAVRHRTAQGVSGRLRAARRGPHPRRAVHVVARTALRDDREFLHRAQREGAGQSQDHGQPQGHADRVGAVQRESRSARTCASTRGNSTSRRCSASSTIA